ncbi:MAG: TonB-dependent receptor domain-containing protein [Flavobacteriales bacterium]
MDRFISAPMLDGFYHYGNPTLDTETNINKRLGLRGMYNKWSWNVEYFHNSLNNLIERRVNTDIASPISGMRGVKQSQNIKNAVITGANAFVSYYATPSLKFTLSASYLRGYDGNNDPLPNIAPLQINPKLTYESKDKDLWVTLKADIANEQTRYAPQYGEIYTPGYATFDLSGGWKVSDRIELSAGFNNLTNQYYRKHLNQAQLPEPGMNIFVSAKYTMPVTGSKTGEPSIKKAKLVKMKIKGMACQFCANTVKERSEALPQVIQSMVYLKDDEAEIIVGKAISIDELTEAIKRAGFKVQVISVLDYEE